MTTAPPTHEVTELLLQWRGGNDCALQRLVPLVYREMRRLAHLQMRDERPGHPLQTTALLHEAYLRLIDASRNRLAGPGALLRHCLACDASRAGRAGQARGAQKRGSPIAPLPFNEEIDASPERPRDLVALDDALAALETVDPRRAKVVELRYFGGLSVEETAEVLKVSSDTVTRDWNRAKVWLFRELGGQEGARRDAG